MEKGVLSLVFEIVNMSKFKFLLKNLIFQKLLKQTYDFEFSK